MSRILIVDDEEQIREVYEMIVESSGVDYDLASSGQEAIGKLAKNKFDLIFCDYRMENGNGADVFRWIRENQPNLPFVLVSTYDPQTTEGFADYAKNPNINRYLSKPFTSDAILKIIDEVIGQNKESQEFGRVKVMRLLNLKQSGPFPVFLKLHEDKLVKIIGESDLLDLEILKRYKQKGFEWAFVPREQVNEILESVLKDVFSNLEKMNTGKIPKDKKVDTLIDSLNSVRELVASLGMDERTLKLAEKSVEVTFNFVSQTNSLNKLLHLLKDRDSYISKHGILSSYLASSMLSKLEWNTPEIRRKIGLACLFQNLSLELEYLAKVQNANDSGFEQLHYKEKNVILEHPRKAVEIINQAQYVDAEVINLISNHHESPTGDGFPRGLNSSQLTPLDGLMILSGHLANSLLSDPTKQVTVVAQDFNELYNKGNFKKIYRALLQVFLESDD